jgi:hypothetical protein
MLLLSKEQVFAILEGEREISNGQYLTDATVRKRTLNGSENSLVYQSSC